MHLAFGVTHIVIQQLRAREKKREREVICKVVLGVFQEK